MDAFTKLTVRYVRDIPELYKYNALFDLHNTLFPHQKIGNDNTK